VHQHAPTVHRYLLRRLGDRVAADDATQETFARALVRRESLREEEKLVPWLLAIAKNVCFEQQRQRRRSTEPLEEREAELASAEPGPEGQLMRREMERAIERALETLREDRRAALLLRVDGELRYEEIASSMGWSLAKVKNEIHRARSQLRAVLAMTLGAIGLVAIVSSPSSRPAIGFERPSAASLCIDASLETFAVESEHMACLDATPASLPEWPPMCR
jgi:RNA polymerase sigma-70 factor, ECF subfamily